jgi:Co/Zn/Cd efflux system component
VVVLTVVMMVVEITTGWIFHSMALLADDWRMSSHVLALGLTAGAYELSRRYANDARFAFGTWKSKCWVALRARFYLAA